MQIIPPGVQPVSGPPIPLDIKKTFFFRSGLDFSSGMFHNINATSFTHYATHFQRYDMSSQSIYTVAKKAGCSPSTVSRVLTNSVRVTPETRARVLAAARAVNFTMRKRIPQVGVLVSDLSGAKLTSYVTQLLRLTMQELVQRNCVIRLLESGQDDWPEEDHYDAIISLAYNESVNRVSSLYSVPVISLNNPLGTGDFYEIYSDHRQSAVLATEYLLTMGHRNIMLICFKKAVGSIVDWGMQERTAGFRETMDKFGLCSEHIAFTDSEPVDNILLRARSNGVTGLIVFSEDELRIPFLLSHIMKLRIPEEMSLIMEELPSVLDYYSPPITAVRQPFERMVAAIMERLDQIFAGDTAPADPVVFHNELVIRESVSRIGNAVCR